MGSPGGSAMWALFEQRLEAENPLGAEIRAREMIEKFVSLPAAEGDPEFGSALAALGQADFRALYNRLVQLTGGPDGLIAGPALEERPLRERRLAELRLQASAFRAAMTGGKGNLAKTDLTAIRACAPVDERIEEVVPRAVAYGATDADVAVLSSAVCEYRAIAADAVLSASGSRLIADKVARALDSLGRASDSLADYAAAEIYFADAQRAYAATGDERAAATCAQKQDAAAQRQVPDGDRKLHQLLASLVTAPARSLERAQALVGLAELAHGNGDEFEARIRLAEALDELAACGFGIPGPEGVEQAVTRWIEAIPPGGSEDPNHFLAAITTVLVLHTQVTVLGQALLPGQAPAEQEMWQLAEIARAIPEHTEAVRRRLQARLGENAPDSPSAQPPRDQDDSDREFRFVMRSVHAQLDMAAAPPDDASAMEQWKEEAAHCVQRARALGMPFTLAQALDAAARVRFVAGDLDAAIAFFEEAYRTAASLAGKQAADQAIIEATALAKLHTQRGDLAAASDAAGRAIDLIERDRYRVNAPFQQAAYLAPHVDAFTAGVFSAWKLGHHDTMLQRMELSKARASIRQLFSPSRHAPADSPYPDAVLLDRQLGELSAAIHQPSPAAEEQALRRRRLELWDLRAGARSDPETTPPAVTVAGIQSLLEPDEVILYYYWLTRQVLLIVTITSDAIAVDRSVLTAEDRSRLELLIDELSSLTGSNLSLDAAFITPLAPVLVPVEGRPLMDGKAKMVISPHRLLHWYPFAAMPYRDEPLVRTFTLCQAPNLTSLLVPRDTPGKVRIAGVAVSAFPGREQTLHALPQVSRETSQMAASYMAAGIPVSLMREPRRADIVRALSDGTLSEAWCLHIATHGYSIDDELSRDAPLESMLELADGSVDGYEIASAGLRCEIVVLTACDSGQLAIRGRGMAEQPGDELFGLPAAFIESGCASVLAPAWPADEEAMSQIVSAFHRHLAHSAAPEAALALAQREFLDSANAKTRRAYFWASLLLTAIGRPLSGNGGSSAHNGRARAGAPGTHPAAALKHAEGEETSSD
jgi:CHAT domain-containing protein